MEVNPQTKMTIGLMTDMEITIQKMQAASSSSGGSELVRCRGSCGGARTPVEVHGRRRAQAVGRPPLEVCGRWTLMGTGAASWGRERGR